MKKLILTLVCIVFVSLTNISAQQTGISKYVFSPNGKMFAAADDAGDVSIWDLSAGRETQSFSTKTKGIDALDFSGDGKILTVSDSSQNRIIFYDAATGKETNRFGYRNLSPYLISGDAATLWVFISGVPGSDSQAGQVDLKTTTLKDAPKISGSNWTADKTHKTLAYYSESDGKIVLISANDGKELRRFPIDPKFLNQSKQMTMNFSAAGDKLFFYRSYSEEDKQDSFKKNYFHNLAAVSTADGKMLKDGTLPFFANPQSILGDTAEISTGADSSKIYLIQDVKNDGKTGRHLTILDANTLQSVGETDFPAEDYDWSTVAPDGKTILTADKTGKLKIWSTVTGRQAGTLTRSQSAFERVAVSADDSKFAAIAGDGTIKIWTADGKEIRKIDTQSPKGKMLAFSPNGQTLVSVHSATVAEEYGENVDVVTFKFWNAATGKLVREFNNHFYPSIAPVNFVVFNRRGDRLIADCGTAKQIDLCFWNAETGEFSGRSFPETDSETVSIFKLADDQPLIFNAGANKKVTPTDDSGSKYLVWDLANEKLVKQTAEQTEAVQAVGENQNALVIVLGSDIYQKKGFAVYNLDGKTKLSGQFENMISDYVDPQMKYGAVFAAAEKSEMPFDAVHSAKIPEVAGDFSKPAVYVEKPDELITEVEIYKLDEPTAFTRLKGHTDDLIDLAFTRTGNRVVTISYDRTLRVWDLLSGKQLFVLK